MANKRKHEDGDGDQNNDASYASPDDIRAPAAQDGVRVPRMKLSKAAKDKQQKLIVVLEKANLEMVKVGKNNELINCEDHMGLIKKYKKDPAFCRPDITHQCLLMLMDSPLNRAGLLKVYIHTRNNVLIDVHPQTRFPRTFKRFANLMVQLLHKMSIRAAESKESDGQKLLHVIKNPITLHLPVGCRKIGTSFQAEKTIHARDLVIEGDERPVVVVIGAHARGPADVDYTEESISISEYPLSAALACTKIVSAFEDGWGIH